MKCLAGQRPAGFRSKGSSRTCGRRHHPRHEPASNALPPGPPRPATECLLPRSLFLTCAKIPALNRFRNGQCSDSFVGVRLTNPPAILQGAGDRNKSGRLNGYYPISRVAKHLPNPLKKGDMSTVAEQLHLAREAKSLTVYQVAEVTKIRTD